MSDAVTIKIKRRASSGNAGSPSSLKSGELAFNENASDKKLYYGYGDDGSGNATSVISIAGEAIPNSGLANSSVTINGSSLALGGTLTLDTDDIGEGSANLYYTDARARAAVSITDAGGDGSLAYNSATGVITYTGPSAAETRGKISVTDAGGDGSLAYDSTTGVITYTGPSAAETRAHFSATGGVSYNSSAGSFTLANVANSELANSSITINSTAVSLGGSITLDSGDIGEGSNLYYTDARSRAAISGDASTGFSYNNSTGVGLLSSIPNSSLANSSISVNGSAIALGGSVSTNFDVSDGSTSSTVSDGGTLTIQGTANEVEVSNSSSTLTVGLPNDVSIANDLTVGGDLTVNGTVTSVNSTTVTIDDKNIELGATASPTDAGADGGGITLKGTTDKTITWVDATDCWTFNQAVNITTGGLKIGGTEVITSARKLINVTLSGLTIDGGTF
nr:hypothetical protein [uncultured Mediterranean phage uvMED]